MAESTSETLDLRGYLRPLRSRWWIVLLIAVLVEGFTYQYFSGKPTTYSANTALLLQLDANANGADPNRLGREQAVIIGTREVARLVAKELKITGDLPGVVTAGPSPGTNFLTLKSTSSDPRSAVALVNAYARVYIEYSADTARAAARTARIAAQKQLAQIPDIRRNQLSRSQLQASIQSLFLQENSAGVDVRQIEPAVAAAAIRPSPKRNAIFALFLGALLGLAVVYGLEHLDRRLKRLEEIGELFDLPVIVAIPGAPRAAKASSAELRLEPPLKEAFRTLRTTLQLPVASATGGFGPVPRTILVTSAISGEGKSTIARNLALAYFEAGFRVALVDADLRRSTVAETFGIQPEPGLAEVLRGAPLTQALRVIWRTNPEHARQTATTSMQAQPVGAVAEPSRRSGLFSGRRPSLPPPQVTRPPAPALTNDNGTNGVAHGPILSVLPSGSMPADPAALLAGGPVDEILRDLAASHDMVIVDTAPLLPVSDAIPLLAEVDGVLIVSRIGASTRHAAAQLTELLTRVTNINVLGVVANDVREQAGYGSGVYGYGDA